MPCMLPCREMDVGLVEAAVASNKPLATFQVECGLHQSRPLVSARRPRGLYAHPFMHPLLYMQYYSLTRCSQVAPVDATEEQMFVRRLVLAFLQWNTRPAQYEGWHDAVKLAGNRGQRVFQPLRAQ
jgi:hypothetical protein